MRASMAARCTGTASTQIIFEKSHAAGMSIIYSRQHDPRSLHSFQEALRVPQAVDRLTGPLDRRANCAAKSASHLPRAAFQSGDVLARLHEGAVPLAKILGEQQMLPCAHSCGIANRPCWKRQIFILNFD